jgi:hypothetical protein
MRLRPVPASFPIRRRNAELSIGAPLWRLSGVFAFALIAIAGSSTTASASINSPTNAIGTVGIPFGYQISSTDTNSGKVYSVSNLPAGLLLTNTNTGLITGLPQVATNQDASVTVASTGATNTTNVLVTINPPAAPVFSGPLTYFGMQGEPLRYALLSEPNHSNVPTTFSVSNLPSGATLISNVTTNAAYTNVVVTNYFINAASIATNGSFVVPVVTRNQGGTNTNNVTFVVSTATNPVITSTNVASGVVGVPFNFDVTAINSPLRFRVTSIQVGAGAPTIGLNITNGPLANGLSFSNVASGGYVFGRVFGTPSVATNVILGLEAINNTLGTGAQTLTINVAPPQPTVILTQPLGEANYVLGSSFFLNAQAFDRLPDAIDPSSVGFTAGGVPVSGTVTRRGEYYGVEFYPTNGAAFPVVATARNKSGQAVTSSPLPMAPQTPQAAFPSIEMLPLFPGPQVQAGGEVTLRARATSPQTAIQRVEFYVNKVFVDAVTVPAAGTANEYQLRWQTPTTPQNFEVHARVVSINIPAGALGLGTPPFYASTITRSPVTLSTVPGVLPSVAIVTPANGAQLPFNVATRVTASANVFGGSIQQVQFYVDGRPLGAADAAAPYSVDFTPTSYGTYQLFAIATSSAGLINISPTVTVAAPELQGGNPTVTLNVPTTAKTGEILTFTADADDADGNIVSVEFLANGAPLPTPDALGNANPDLAAPYRYAFAPGAPGRYELIARATDNSGNVTDSSMKVLTVSVGTPPTVDFTIGGGTGDQQVAPPGLTASRSGDSVLFTFVARNGVDYIIQETSSLSSGGWAASSVTPVDSPDQADVAFGYTRKQFSVPVGPTPRFFRVTHAATTGNQFNVNQTAFLQANASDSDGAIRQVEFLINGLPQPPPLVRGPFRFDLQLLTPGRYEIVARATDNLGNVTDSAPQIVTVTSGKAPTVSITTPNDGLKVPQTPLTVSWNAFDSDGSVTSVELLVNGVAFGSPSNFGTGAVVYTPSSAGSYVFVARATDNLGNVTDSTPVTVTIDNTVANPLPDVNLLLQTINQNNLVVGSQFYFNATAAAPTNTIITNVSFSVITSSGLRQISAANSQINFGINNIYSAAYALTPVNLTTSTAFAAAKDSATNTGTSSAFSWSTFPARQSLPLVEVLTNTLPSAPTNPVAGGVVQLRAKAAFPGSSATDGVVEFYANGALIGTALANSNAGTLGQFTHALDWTSPTNATNSTITARAIGVNYTVIVGTNTISYYGSSLSPNSRSINFTNGTPPSVSITTPATNKAVVGVGIGNQVTATATAATNASIREVQFYLDGIYQASVTNFPYTYNFTPASAGLYNFAAVAIDSFGLQANSEVRTVNATIGTPPTSFLKTSASATASAQIAGGQVTDLTLTNSGSGYTNAPAVRLVGGTTNTIATANAVVSNGAVTGFTGLPSGAGYSNAPTVVIDPPPVAVGTNSTVLLQAAAGDTDGTIRQVDFLQNGLIVATVTNAPYEFLLPVTAIGRYELTARATDNLGNVTDSPYIVLLARGGSSPVVSVADPANGSSVTPGVPVTVTANASDSDGSVVRVELLVNGVVVGTDTQAPFIFADAGQFSADTNTTFTPPSEGQYVIVARAVDNVGNVTDSAAVTVTATAPPVGAPTVQMTQPLGEIYYVDGSSYFLNARITDAPPGTINTNSIKFTVNGLQVTGSSMGRIGDDYGVRYRPSNLFGIDAARAEATDNEGNRGISQPNYTVLTIPQYPLPTVKMLPLLPNTPTNAGGRVKLRAEALFPSTASAEARVEFYANNVFVGTATNDPTDAAVFVYDWSTPTNQASYVVQARAVARNFQTAVGEGNVVRFFGSIISDNATAVNTIPGVAPTVSITQPTNGQNVNVNQPLNIRANATNSGGTIGRVEFFANGQLVGVDTNAVYEANFTPPSTGLYNLSAIAYTESGILKVSDTVTVNSVLGSPPAVTVQAPAKGAVGGTVTLSASATPIGDGRNITAVEFLVNNIVVSTDNAYPYLYDWVIQAPGNYQIQARATDNVGNIGLSAVQSLVTYYEPVVSLTALPTTVRQGETVQLRSRAFTDESGVTIANVLFANETDTPLPSPGANGGANPDTTTNSSGFYEYYYIATQPGTIRLKAIATDTAGNQGQSPLVPITVEADASVPIINITSPAANSRVELNTPLLITAGASPGANATITSVQFRVVDPDGILTTLTATQTDSPYSVSYTGVTKPGFYNITAQVFNSAGKSNVSNVVVEAVSVPPPVPGTNSAFVYDMFRLLFYRAASPLEADYWTEWLNEQTPGGDLAPLSVRAQMVMNLMGFNAGGGVFTQSSGPATSASASYQATSGTALQPYGRLGVTPSRALVLEFLADILSDVSENPPSGKPLPIEGSYSGIPGAPYGATYGMAGGMQTVFNSTPFQSAYPGITSLDNNAFVLWLMNTMFQGRALGDGVAVRNMMNSFVPQSDRQGSGAAFFTRLEGTILGNYSYFDPSGTALEKAFQLQVNSAALRFQLQGSAPQFWNYTTAPAYSQAVVENYINLYWDDVQ